MNTNNITPVNIFFCVKFDFLLSHKGNWNEQRQYN